MPILRVDQFGRIYETSRDSETGGGYGHHATPVTQGDVTLGSAYLKANKNYQDEVLKNSRMKKIEESERQAQLHAAKRRIAVAKQKAYNEAKLRENEAYQNYLTKKALQMGSGCIGCGCGDKTRDQKALESHLKGMGVDSSHMISQSEIKQRLSHNSNLRAATLQQQAREQKTRLQHRRGR